MNREIKFRGKSLDHGYWLTGYLTAMGEGRMYITRKIAESKLVPCMEVAPDSIGQYIGLTDYHCREIYEGDILKSYEYNYDEEKDIAVYCAVAWDSNVCGFIITDQTTEEEIELNDLGEWEVIGNIYDNPELLTTIKNQ